MAVPSLIQPDDGEDSAACNLYGSGIRHCWPVPSMITQGTQMLHADKGAEASVWAGREALVEGAVQENDSEFRLWSCTEWSLKPSPAAPGYHLGRAFSFSVSWVFPLVFTGMKRFSVMIKGGMQGKTEKAMATHSNTLVWKIPGTEEPKRLQSMGSLRVRND